MSALSRRARAFLGLPALDDPAATTRLRIVPWRAAPAAFVVALAVLSAVGAGLQRVLHGRDNWQVNAPAIAGLTAILLLAPSSPTQARARNAWAAALVGLAVVAGGFAVAAAGHKTGTAYGARAFAIATAGALAGSLGFTALTRVDRWSAVSQAGSVTGAPRHAPEPGGGERPATASPTVDGRAGGGTPGQGTTAGAAGEPPTVG
jgi:hypothetical protein